MKLSLEDRINLMRAIEDYPIENQRQLAEVINLSLGKTNFILKSLINLVKPLKSCKRMAKVDLEKFLCETKPCWVKKILESIN